MILILVLDIPARFCRPKQSVQCNKHVLCFWRFYWSKQLLRIYWNQPQVSLNHDNLRGLVVDIQKRRSKFRRSSCSCLFSAYVNGTAKHKLVYCLCWSLAYSWMLASLKINWIPSWIQSLDTIFRDLISSSRRTAIDFSQHCEVNPETLQVVNVLLAL